MASMTNSQLADKLSECVQNSERSTKVPTQHVEDAIRRLRMSDRTTLLNRFEAAIRLVYPEDMTPAGKRIFCSIVEDER